MPQNRKYENQIFIVCFLYYPAPLLSLTDGHLTNFTFDGNGNKTRQTTTRTIPGAGVQTLVSSTVYDGADRPTQSIRADGSRSFTTYNAINQVAFTRDSLNRLTSFEYDSLGQKIGATYPDGSSTSSSYDANFV